MFYNWGMYSCNLWLIISDYSAWNKILNRKTNDTEVSEPVALLNETDEIVAEILNENRNSTDKVKEVLMKYIYECYPDLSNEEEMVEVFEKIIRSRDDQDLGNLEQERDLRKEKLKDVKKQLEIIEQLQKSIEETNVRIKCYEEYFVDMEKFKEKKEASILKLTEEVEEKRTMLRDQEEILSKKQALYDAQGFDGKKHLTHFEELKKELNENLQQNRASLRNLQEECWSLDIEYTKILDKGKELSKKLIQTISQVSDVVKASFQNLRNIKDPQVQNVCNSFRIEIPECPTDSSQRAFMAWIDAHKEALEEIQKKIVKTIIIIKTIISAKTEEQTSIEMKKIQLSAKLKCSSSVEFQKEHDLANLEKLAVEEVRALKDKCDKDLSKFEELQKDKREKFDKLSKLKSDMQEVLKIKKNKSEMLEKFKREHEKMVAILKSKLETAINESEEYGFEIVAELQELITKYKRETE
ncbi:uncharacterized protein PF3D7_1120000 isoform X2 [Parasteatoda tepidariorum]|uniref:uncharacterized protein PF3D7_1120000 isoform X2 n=1 Tax=Parasteatoda tepidariorum TaxID=114398 RepID=UPI0039BD8FD0